MSFRSSASKVMPAQSDPARGPHGTRRAQDGDLGSTAPPKRSTRFRISAAMNPTMPDLDVTTDPAHAQARKAPPSSFAQPGMTNNDQTINDVTQNAGPRSFLQTRRRQPSTNNAKLPHGPRPLDYQGSNNHRYVRSCLPRVPRLTRSVKNCEYCNASFLQFCRTPAKPIRRQLPTARTYAERCG